MPRILSIEDDEDTQHLIGNALFRDGYEVHYAWNGREGYEKILSLDPDLILLDLMLPMMNGVDLLKKLQDNKVAQDIPVVIVTGFGDEANMLGHSVKALGAADYLRKPVQIQELLQLVKKTLLHHPRAKPAGASPAPELRKGVLKADPRFRTLWINDRLVATLPHKEFALLQCLMKKPGPVSQDHLLKAMGYGAKQRNALKQAVHRLRAMFGENESRRIQTSPQGYELIG